MFAVMIMQTIEALLSLTVFLLITSAILIESQVSHSPDDSLYRMQLAGDIWRVLYLKGNFENLDDAGRVVFESDATRIRDMTGLCIFIGGIRNTNCRGGQEHERIVTMKKIVVVDGQPKEVTFSVSK